MNGATGGNNLIQLTGQNASSSIDALQQAYAGLQQFAGEPFRSSIFFVYQYLQRIIIYETFNRCF